MRVGQLPPRVQLIELRPIRCERTTSVRRHAIDHPGQREIEPRDGAISQHQCPVVGFGECAAAGCHNRMSFGEQLAECLAFELTEVRLAVLREDRRNRPPLARLDPFVDVLDAPAPMNPTR
jgi:hypothetical protein